MKTRRGWGPRPICLQKPYNEQKIDRILPRKCKKKDAV